MKIKAAIRLTYLVVVLVLVSSCNFIIDPWQDFTYDLHHDEHFEEIADVLNWTSHEIQGDSSYYPEKYWPSPQEIYDSRIGDCKAYALMSAYFLWADLGLDEVYIVALESGSRTQSGHAIINFNGEFYEPQLGGWQVGNQEWDPIEFWGEYIDDMITTEYPVQEILWSVVNTHNRQPIINSHLLTPEMILDIETRFSVNSPQP